jgi:NitT/TauT family transport system ATP-binding protein
MIRIRELSKEFDNLRVLENINLNISKGEFVVLLGSNGSGKTTLLRIISGLEKPTKGEVFLGGDVSFVFQEPALFPWKNVEKNISFGLEIKRVKNSKEIVKKYIKYFGLEGFEKYYPKDLSGGMKQKVVLARALAVNSKIILMDEPFSNLDSKSKKRIEIELLDIKQAFKKTIVFVTHDIREAVFLGDRVILFSAKTPTRIVAEFDCNGGKKKKKDVIEKIRKFNFCKKK